jgi:hypothetical protein
MQTAREAPNRRAEDMEERARALVDAHSHFAGRAQQFEFQYADGVLVVRGRVPTFYLKQTLQHALKRLDGVRRIDNQVAVVSSEGLVGRGD